MYLASLPQNIANGLLIGGIYGLTAMGLSLIFGVLKVINFAHGSFLMVGMYLTYLASTMLHMDPYVSIVLVAPIMFVAGYGVQRAFITPLIKRERAKVVEPVSVLLLTTGMLLILDHVAQMIFTANFRTITVPYSSNVLYLFGVGMNVTKLVGTASALVIGLVLYVFLKRTTLGKMVQATAQDREAAWLQGIDIDRIYAVTFGIGTAVAGVAGSLLMPFYQVYPTVGLVFITKTFIVVVLGGMDSVGGALIAGFLVGLIEGVSSVFMKSSSTQAVVFLFFIVVLLIRPNGLISRAARQ